MSVEPRRVTLNASFLFWLAAFVFALLALVLPYFHVGPGWPVLFLLSWLCWLVSLKV